MGMRIEHSDIKVRTPLALVPEVLCPYVQSCSFLHIRGSLGETLSSQGLESGLNPDIGALGL